MYIQKELYKNALGKLIHATENWEYKKAHQ